MIEQYINKVINGDCLDVMKNIPDNSIDLILTDPPYGIDIANSMAKASNWKGGNALTHKGLYTFSDWDKKIPDKEVFTEIFRVSKNQVICGGNYFTEFLKPTKSWIIWDKRTDDKYNNYFSDCELIWTSFDKSAKIFRYLWSGMLQQDMKNKEKRYHPTQKPVALGEWILKNYSNNNDIIFDPFCGSGSFLVACSIMGNCYIGVEKDKNYFKIAKERLRIEMIQGKIF